VRGSGCGEFRFLDPSAKAAAVELDGIFYHFDMFAEMAPDKLPRIFIRCHECTMPAARIQLELWLGQRRQLNIELA